MHISWRGIASFYIADRRTKWMDAPQTVIAGGGRPPSHNYSPPARGESWYARASTDWQNVINVRGSPINVKRRWWIVKQYPYHQPRPAICSWLRTKRRLTLSNGFTSGPSAAPLLLLVFSSREQEDTDATRASMLIYASIVSSVLFIHSHSCVYFSVFFFFFWRVVYLLTMSSNGTSLDYDNLRCNYVYNCQIVIALID